VSETELRALVAKHTLGRQLGVLGEPRTNVLELNLELDTQHPTLKIIDDRRETFLPAGEQQLLWLSRGRLGELVLGGWKRYPTQGSVRMYFGCAGSLSIFLRN